MIAYVARCRACTRNARQAVLPLLTGIFLLVPYSCQAFADQDNTSDQPRGVSALGRIEPRNGVLRISASSVPEAMSGAVLTELRVDIGDDVEQGQLLAVTDAASVLAAKLVEA